MTTSSSSASLVRPSRTIVTTFGLPRVAPPPPSLDGHDSIISDVYESGVWVHHSCSSTVGGSSDGFIGCALTNGDVQVYDTQTLQRKQTYSKCHASTITDLTASSSHAGGGFMISSGIRHEQHGSSIVLYDVRQPTPALSINRLPNQQEDALSVSLGYDAALIAAVGGSKANVHFYDLRNANSNSNNGPLGTYHDAHTEEVTRVRFKANSPLLISASEDGLCCIFDTSKPSEDAALVNVLNVGSPLRQVGFFGDEGIYCLTGSETFSVWHYPSAQRISNYFDNDLRNQLGKLLSNHNHNNAQQQDSVDYLVDCLWDGEQLLLLGGCRSHHDPLHRQQQPIAAIFQVNAGAISLRHVLQTGHQGDIRSWCSCVVAKESDYNNTNIYTVGEDARICEWNLKATTKTHPTPTTKSSSAGGGRIRREKTKQTNRPY